MFSDEDRYESFMTFASYGKNPMDIHFFDEDDRARRQSFLDAIDEDDVSMEEDDWEDDWEDDLDDEDDFDDEDYDLDDYDIDADDYDF